MPPSETKTRPVKQQYRDARSELLVGLAGAGVPWALFLLLTIVGNILRFVVSGKLHEVGDWLTLTACLAGFAGTGAAALDAHLRRHRMSKVGRLIGPVTTEAGTVMLVTFLLAGYSMPLVLVWGFGGVFTCLGWNMWQRHAVHHDLTIGFTSAAQRAGLGEARLTPARQPKPLLSGSAQPAGRPVAAPPPARAPRVRPTVTGIAHWPAGEVTPQEAADRAAQLESSHHWPPGAASLLPNRQDGAASDFVLSDPANLEVPLLWPGPSAPGADLSVPFRLGWRQDGRPWLTHVVPVGHMRASGKTGSGKTKGWLYSFQGEAVSRQDYATFITDTVKGLQFIGPLIPALHGYSTTTEAALEMYLALKRARAARLDYLYRQGLTEWRPGCGLTFLDAWMEEAASTLAAMAELSKGKHGSQAFTFADWLEGVRADRSHGQRHDVSMQFGRDTEFPTPARGQFGNICFGTSSKGESRIGLSAEQADNGARPELWGSKYPGMAYVDPGTANGDDTPVTMPVRLCSWGDDAAMATGYFAGWPADDRPLDDITAEAMEDRPALPPSYGFPVTPAQRPAGKSNVIPGRFGRAKTPDRHEQADAAAEAALQWLREWQAAGRDGGTFTSMDMQNAGVHQKADRSRAWLYEVIENWVQRSIVEQVAEKPKKRWKILAQLNSAEEM